MNIKYWCIASAILLFLGIFAWPYNYYVFLRFFVCIVAGVTSYKFFESNLGVWGWVFVGVAYLFNPIFPVYLDKGTWVMIDLVASVLFVLSVYSSKPIRVKK